ncbi:hypothetical protein [Novosphingobium guangzhouense]|uniref:Uncharacterized protein n=1 Tax=Novosphingobium guangzhouense TaxID=1850347 RepID=A0A2K2G495_9SPHN|nr:hypothetical protein [Novosphingobium guangzhouense]PNU05841.1 hypothetical protein A8V01_14850 [Novosphingobium guangzhouense]
MIKSAMTIIGGIFTTYSGFHTLDDGSQFTGWLKIIGGTLACILGAIMIADQYLSNKTAK